MQQKAQKQLDMLQKVQVLPVTSPLVGQTCICHHDCGICGQADYLQANQAGTTTIENQAKI